MRRIQFPKIALLAALSMSLPMYAQAQQASFVPEQVFAGRSEGRGTLTLLGGTRRFVVHSLGTTEGNGHLRLEQDVRFEGKAARSRTWMMRQVATGRYTARLTDAAGPVVGRTDGRRLILRYPLKRWGLVMHQTLELSADAQTLDNHGSIRFMGMEVGRLRETIRLMH